MKKGFSYILAYLTLGSVILTQAVNGATIDVYANHEYNWNGYMNWFEKTSTGTKGGYVWGSGWGVSDLKTTITTTSFVLQPNFNTYANNVGGSAADQAYWTDGAGGGNKWMEAATYIERTGWFHGNLLTFSGNVTGFNLDPGYTAKAYIRGFVNGYWDTNANGGTGGWINDVAWGSPVNTFTNLSSTGSFSVSRDFGGANGFGGTWDDNDIIQYGFLVEGINGNPANESTLGAVTIASVPEPSSATLLGLGVAGLLVARLRRRS